MKKISLIALSVCMFIISLNNVSAEAIHYKRLPNIYFNLTVDGVTESNHVTAFILGNRLAYCIEPGKDITTKDYDTYTDWSKTTLTKETIDYIEKIGYYGYEYPGHQTDRYYIATQELIWKTIKPVEITWTTEKNKGGSIINIEKEKEEIIKLVNEHDKKPSFIDKLITGKINETKEIEDTNNVLQNYEISSSKNIKIENNKLKITFDKEETKPEEITLTKKAYDSNTLLVYAKEGSQQLAALRLSNKEEVKFQIQTIKEPEKEIVKVPSTSDDDVLKKFSIKWKVKNDIRKFN